MKKYKLKIAQLTLVAALLLATIYIIQNAVAVVIAADDYPLPPTVEQPDNISNIINSADASATNCRYGVSVTNAKDYNVINDLGVGWTLNFNVNFNNAGYEHIEYTPMVRFQPKLDASGNRTGNYLVNGAQFNDNSNGLGPIIAANPGRLWLVGNEVDRTKHQDDLMPEVYAKAYHDAYHFIKQRDPSALVAVSGLVQVTPGRLQYLDIVWDTYLATYGVPMPVDVWNMHIYILPEKLQNGEDAAAAIALGTDPALAIWESGNRSALCSANDVYCYAEHDSMVIFKQQTVAMRQWMKDHGQQNKPLILSEYSLLHPYNQEGDTDPNTCYLKDENGNCFTPERVSKFMANTFEYLETTTDPTIGFPSDNNRLVQQWLWFTVKYYSTFSSNLVEEGYTETNYTFRLPGKTFQAQMNGLRPFSVQPSISQVNFPAVSTSTENGTTSATLAATVLNNGDTKTTASYTVKFYADSAKKNLIGTATIPAGLTGCAIRTVQAEVVWDNLGTGVHRYWAVVEGGNTLSGFVLVNPEQVFLPIVAR